MQANRILFCAMIALVTIAGCSPAPTVDTAAEAEEIRETSRLWNEAVIAKDIQAATAYFTPDGMLMPQNSEIIAGRGAIQEWFEGWVTDPNISNSFKADVVEVAASGDIAYERGTYTFAMETPEGRIEDEGKYVVIWKKIDGEWKALLDISNSSLPLP
ncbi:MAG: SgcJ/EcaC family oxidoreductase [Bacteroidota bacterium]